MCGRYSFVASAEKVKLQLGNQMDTGLNLKVNFNVAPTQSAYVIANDNPQKLQYFTWGLIPYWSNDGKKSGRLINARQEGIISKPSFRMPVRKRRCLVLADSFYEWKREGNKKIPYRILYPSEDLILMAGIWDIWSNGQEEIKSFSIITTPPNREMESIHNRMPVILAKKEQQQQWLEEEDTEKAIRLLRTLPNKSLKMYRVSEQVNSVKNNSPLLHQKMEEPPSLFD